MNLNHYELQRMDKAATTEGPVEDQWLAVKTSRPIRGKKDAARYVRQNELLGEFRVIAVIGTINAKAIEHTVWDVAVEVG